MNVKATLQVAVDGKLMTSSPVTLGVAELRNLGASAMIKDSGTIVLSNEALDLRYTFVPEERRKVKRLLGLL